MSGIYKFENSGLKKFTIFDFGVVHFRFFPFQTLSSFYTDKLVDLEKIWTLNIIEEHLFFSHYFMLACVLKNLRLGPTKT